MEVEGDQENSNDHFCYGFVDQCFKYVKPLGIIEHAGTVKKTVSVKKIASSEYKEISGFDEHDNKFYVDPFTGEIQDLVCDGNKYGHVMERENSQSCFSAEEQNEPDQEIVDCELQEIKSEFDGLGIETALIFKKIVKVAFHLVCKVRVCQLSNAKIFHGYGRNIHLSPEEILKFKWDILIESNKQLDSLIKKCNARRSRGSKSLKKENAVQLKKVLLFRLQNALFSLRPDNEKTPDVSNKNYTWVKDETREDRKDPIMNELSQCIDSEYMNTIMKIQTRVSDIVNDRKQRKTKMDLTAYIPVMMREASWQTKVNKNEQSLCSKVEGKSPMIQIQAASREVDHEVYGHQMIEAHLEGGSSVANKKLCEKTGKLISLRKHPYKNKKSADQSQLKALIAASNTGQGLSSGKKEVNPIIVNVADPVSSHEKATIKPVTNKVGKEKGHPNPMKGHGLIRNSQENSVSAIYKLLPFIKEINYPVIIQSIRVRYEQIHLRLKSQPFDFKQWIIDHAPTADKDLVSDSNLDVYFRNIRQSQLMQQLSDIASCITDTSRPALSITLVTHELHQMSYQNMKEDLLSETGTSSEKSIECLSDELGREFQALNRLAGCINSVNSSSTKIHATKVEQLAEENKKYLLSFKNGLQTANQLTEQAFSVEKRNGIHHIPITEITFTTYAFLMPNQLSGLSDNYQNATGYQLVKLKEVLETTMKENYDKIKPNTSENFTVNLPAGSLLIKDSNVFINSGNAKPPSVLPIVRFSFSAHEAMGYMHQSFQLYNAEIVCNRIFRILLAILIKFRKSSWFSRMIKGNEVEQQLPRIKDVFSLRDGIHISDERLFRTDGTDVSLSANGNTAADVTRHVIGQEMKEKDHAIGLCKLENIKLEDGTEIKVELNDAFEKGMNNHVDKNVPETENKEINPSGIINTPSIKVENMATNEDKTMSEKANNVNLETCVKTSSGKKEEMDHLDPQNLDILNAISDRLKVLLNENAVYILKSFCNQTLLDKRLSEYNVNRIKVILEFLGQGCFTESETKAGWPDGIVIRKFQYSINAQPAVQYHIIQKRSFPPQGFQYVKTRKLFHVFGIIPYPFELCTLLNTSSTQTEWLCSVCLKVFKDIDSYLAHESDAHSRWLALVCSKCSMCLTEQTCEHRCKKSPTRHKSKSSGTQEQVAVTESVNTKIRQTFELCDSCAFVLENLDSLISLIMTKTRVIIFKCDECSSCFPQRPAFNIHKSFHKLINKQKLVLKRCQVCYHLYSINLADKHVEHTSPSVVEKLKEILYALFEDMESKTKTALNASPGQVKRKRKTVTKRELEEWKSYLSNLNCPEAQEFISHLKTYGPGADTSDSPVGKGALTLTRLDQSVAGSDTDNKVILGKDGQAWVYQWKGEQKKGKDTTSSSSSGENECNTISENSGSQTIIPYQGKRENDGYQQKPEPTIESSQKTLNKIQTTTVWPPIDGMVIDLTDETPDADMPTLENTDDRNDKLTSGYGSNSDESNVCKNKGTLQMEPIEIDSDESDCDRIPQVKAERIEIDDEVTDNPIKTEVTDDCALHNSGDIGHETPKVIGDSMQMNKESNNPIKTEVTEDFIMNHVGDIVSGPPKISDQQFKTYKAGTDTSVKTEVNEDVVMKPVGDIENNPPKVIGQLKVKDEPDINSPIKTEVIDNVIVQTMGDISNYDAPKVLDQSFAKKHLMELLLKCYNESEMKQIVTEALQWKLNGSNLFTEQDITLIVREVFQILESRTDIIGS